MAKESDAQKKTVTRVMHEYKHGELKSGPDGKAGKVKSRKQAVAIALHEAGASKNESPRKNKQNLRKTKAKEHRGATAMQAKEGKRSLRALGDGTGKTRAELYQEAKKRDVPGRSKMTKAQLAHALRA